MKEKKYFIKKIGMFMILLVLCLAVFPGNVEAKKSTKKVKIYNFTSGDKKVDKKVRSVIKKYIKPKMSTAERVKVIHDYIVLNCEYDYSNYLKGTVSSDSYTPKGVLLKKRAVCEGYAETFKLFMDALGIPCEMVSGTAGSDYRGWGRHAWNVVKISGKWYQIDVTWDDPTPDEKGRLFYDYFLITDKQMKKDHKWTSSRKCKTNNSKFATLFGKVSKTMESTADEFYKQYQKDSKQSITIVVPKKLYKKSNYFVFDLFDKLDEKYHLRVAEWSDGTTVYGKYYVVTVKVKKMGESFYSYMSTEDE